MVWPLAPETEAIVGVEVVADPEALVALVLAPVLAMGEMGECVDT